MIRPEELVDRLSRRSFSDLATTEISANQAERDKLAESSRMGTIDSERSARLARGQIIAVAVQHLVGRAKSRKLWDAHEKQLEAMSR